MNESEPDEAVLGAPAQGDRNNHAGRRGQAGRASEDHGPRHRAGSVAVALAGAVTGLILAFVALMDWTKFANYAFVLCLLLAHICLGVLLGYFFNAWVPRDRRPLRHQRNKVWRAGRWGFLAVATFIALVYLDSFVFGLAERGRTRTVLIVLSLFAVAAGIGWVVVAERTANLSRRGAKLSQRLLTAVAALPIGALVLLVPLDSLSDQRQGQDDDVVEDLSAYQIVLPDEHPNYVALGDSYSAGEGITPFTSSTTSHCHRSAYAYPRLLAFAKPAHVEFRACSGAVTADVDLGSPGGYGPQIDPSEREDVGLVTVTLGGNDVVFSTVVRECILFEDCVHQRFETPEALVERPTVRFPDADLEAHDTFEEWASAALTDDYLGGNIDRVYARMRDTYPEARIVVIGYPYLFPDQPAEWRFSDCASILRRVDHDERKQLRDLMDDLNAMLATKAYENGLEFISPVSAWAGHEPCGVAEDQWVNSIRLDLTELHNLAVVNGSTFHPNRLGQAELGRLISCYLIEHPTAIESQPPITPGDIDYQLYDETGACVPPPGTAAD